MLIISDVMTTDDTSTPNSSPPATCLNTHRQAVLPQEKRPLTNQRMKTKTCSQNHVAASKLTALEFMHRPAAVLVTILAMAASSNSSISPAEKRMAEQGVEQKFVAETQKESLEMDKMIAQQQQLHREPDGSSVGSLGSFSVVDLTSEDGEELTRELNAAEIDQIQLEETNLRVGDGLRKCFCGMVAKFYVSRKVGANFGRRFQRCPKAIGMQCDYFMWIEPAKKVIFEDIVDTRGVKQKGYQKEMEKPGLPKDPAAKSSRESSKHSPLVSDQALGEISAPKDLPTVVQQCTHLWDRSGTNGSEERMTCNRCGLRFRRNKKTDEITWEMAHLEEEKADREKNAVKRKEARAYKEALAKSLEAALKR